MMHKLKLLVYIPGLFILVCMVYAAFCSFPGADDFCYASATRNSPDFLETVFNEYFVWNGRYASNFLMFSNPMAIDKLALYQVMPILLLILAWWCMDSLLKQVLFIHTKQRILLSLLAVVVVVMQLPSMAEGFYWYTGSVTYFLAGALGWLIMALVLQLEKAFSIPVLLFAMFLLFVFVGFNESAMQYTLAFFGVYLIQLLLNGRFEWWLILLLAVIAAGTCIMVLAPGNAVRAKYFENTHQFWYSAGQSILQSGRFFILFIAHPSVVIASLAFFLFPMHRYVHGFVKEKSPMFFIALIALTLFLAAFASYYYTGILGQHRTYNLALMFFYPCWFGLLISWTYRLNLATERLSPLKALRIALFVLPVSYNAFYLIKETTDGTLRHFSHESKQRLNNLANDKPLKPMQTRSVVLSVADTDGTESHWISKCSCVWKKSIK